MKWEYVGTGLAILAIGITVILAVPPPWWPKMPPALVQVSVVIGLMLAAVGFGITGLGTWPGLPNPRGPIALLLIGSFLTAIGGVWWTFVPALGARTLNLQFDSSPSVESKYKQGRRPLTMREIFDSDFPSLAKIFVIQKTGKPNEYSFPAIEYIDITTSSYFLAFFIDNKQPTVLLSKVIANIALSIHNNISQILLKITTPASTRTLDTKRLRFSRQIYLYFDRPLSIEEKYEIFEAYNSLDYDVIIYDHSYHIMHWKEFDRLPRSADENNPGVQLPAVEIGTQISIENRIGSLPSTTTIQVALPPTPTPQSPLKKR
jgi:hypothetical protein